MLGGVLHKYTSDDIELISRTYDINVHVVKVLHGMGVRSDEWDKVMLGIDALTTGWHSLSKIYRVEHNWSRMGIDFTDAMRVLFLFVRNK